MASPEAEKALSRARIHLMSREETTFFSVVCLSLVHMWCNKIPTACTNGLNIRYNEAFFMACKPAERVGLILHEVLHVIFQHMLRIGDRAHKRWNRACDYVINLIIIDAGFRLPEGALISEDYRGMSAEEVYELLDDNDDEDCWDDLIPGDGTPIDEVKDKIDDIIVQAAQQAEAAGDSPSSIPGDIRRYIDKLTNPEIPWHRVLAGFYRRLAKTEYRFTKPNRRFFTQGILMPSLCGEKLEKGAVSIDVSGSVEQYQFDSFISETAAILKDQQPDVLHFLQWDTRITRRDDITCVRDLSKIEIVGGGGTNIKPLLEYANEENPDWLLVFTDGHFDMPDLRPKCPIIWVVHSNPGWKAPFGKTIHFNFKEKEQAAWYPCPSSPTRRHNSCSHWPSWPA